MQRLLLHRYRSVSAVLILTTAITWGQRVVAGDWLTQSERDFFGTFGSNAKINATDAIRSSNFVRLGTIQAKAEEPLRGSIRTIVAAFE